MMHPDEGSSARHWMIIVRSVKEGKCVEINAIPGDAPATFYLQAGLTLPDNHKVSNIAFYGDNGNSSLSPNLDIDAVTNEGRQSLGLIVERKKCLPDGAEELHQELWLVKYDDISFEKFDFASSSDKQIGIAGVDFGRDNCIHLQPLESSHDVDDVVMVPKSKLVSRACLLPCYFNYVSNHLCYPLLPTLGRHICTHQSFLAQEQTKLDLCGSRGTAGVISFGVSTSLDILDLEEDEEEDDTSDASDDESD